MMLPSIFGENLLDNWFDDGWNSWDYIIKSTPQEAYNSKILL